MILYEISGDQIIMFIFIRKIGAYLSIKLKIAMQKQKLLCMQECHDNGLFWIKVDAEVPRKNW